MPSSEEAVEKRRQEIIAVSAILHHEVSLMLKSARDYSSRFAYDEDDAVSMPRITDAVKYALRDLDRLDDEQAKGSSLTKFLGYIGFWFAKLKPIMRVDVLRDGTVEDSEILNINEQFVFPLLRRLMIRMTREGDTDIPKTWLNCTNVKCTKDGTFKKGSCFQEKFLHYLRANDERHHKYLYYTLRYRDAAPYMLVALLDQAIYFSCEALVPALYG